MIEYLKIALYLALFFGAFTSYRRLILAEYHISYGEYGISLIKALVLAKVIMLGDVLRLGRRLEDRPLIFPAIYQTVVFTLWVVLFSIVESALRGLLHGKGLAGGLDELIGKGMYELLAGCLVVFFALIPFFAFREMERVLGKGRIHELFFRGGIGQKIGLVVISWTAASISAISRHAHTPISGMWPARKRRLRPLRIISRSARKNSPKQIFF
jgi:hypothetical protein